MEFTFLENALIRGIFTHALPHSKLAPKFLSSRPRQGNYLFPQGAFFRKSVSPNNRKGGGNYDLLYQNSVRKYEDDLEH